MIDSQKLPMTHVTEQTGSPQILVVKKDRRDYHQRCERYREDTKALSELQRHAAAMKQKDHYLLAQIDTALEARKNWQP